MKRNDTFNDLLGDKLRTEKDINQIFHRAQAVSNNRTRLTKPPTMAAT